MSLVCVLDMDILPVGSSKNIDAYLNFEGKVKSIPSVIVLIHSGRVHWDDWYVAQFWQS